MLNRIAASMNHLMGTVDRGLSEDARSGETIAR